MLFVGARCESLQQTAQLSADMHYTWICMNTMTNDDDDGDDNDDDDDYDGHSDLVRCISHILSFLFI